LTFDVLLVVGSVLAILSGLSMANTLIEGRTPWIASVSVLISIAILIWAIRESGDGLQLTDFPNAVAGVIGLLLNK